MASPENLRVAIIGAGIAGLATAIALRAHPSIDVQIFEQAKELREIGASIALGPNGLRTLDKLGVLNALDDSIAIRNESGCPMVYRHWRTNEVISVDSHHGEVERRHRTARFYRPHLQEALLAHIPNDIIHLGKTFSAVVADSADDLIVTFQDGSTTSVDILLGADGIKSAVRTSFVPSSAPKWTGWVAYRSVFPETLLEGLVNELEDSTNHWWGPDRAFFAGRLGRGLFTIVGSSHADPNASNALLKDWNSEADTKALQDLYDGWHPIVQKMVAASPYTRTYPNTFASAIDTWSLGDGRVSLIGDAAHAHGGALATGGSLAIEDAYAVALAIRHLFPETSRKKPSRNEIRDALALYEKIRKPHTDRVRAVVEASNKKQIERMGKKETEEELLTRMQNRLDPHWIHEHDVGAEYLKLVAKDEAIQQPRL